MEKKQVTVTRNPAGSKALTIKEYISAPAVQEKVKEMLLDKDSIRNFTTSVMALAGSDELLATAEPRSLFNAALTAASLNLSINKNLGFAHIIGYRNNKKGNIVEAQFQLGARGFKELAQRSGRYKLINQGDVRTGELLGRNRLTGELELKFESNDEKRAKLDIVGYFSYFRLDNGFESTLYMSVDEIKAHAKRFSQAYKAGYGPWKDMFDAMALKTVMKLNISKNGPLDINLQKAVATDQAVVRDNNELEYIDGTDMAVEDEKADEDTKAAIIAANTNKTTGEIEEDK